MRAPTKTEPSERADSAQRAARHQRLFGRSALTLGIVFLAMQFIPYGHNLVNPSVNSEPPWNSPRTRELFVRACADCHSNQTMWPWYSQIAPASWLLQHDVKEGRAEFNISEWDREENEGEDAAEQLRKGEMPLWTYTLTHADARLSESEKQELAIGLSLTFGRKDDESKESREHQRRRREESE